MYLIVGATGSLGGRVAKQLLGRGERVRAVARPESPLRGTGRFTDPSELESLGAELVEADLRQPASLEPHLTGVTAVAMTASGTKRMPPDTGEAVDFEGAAALAAAAERAGVRHLVYLSARAPAPTPLRSSTRSGKARTPSARRGYRRASCGQRCSWRTGSAC